MKTRELLKKDILQKNSEPWVYGELNTMLDKGVEVIEKNLELGNINEVNDKVISWVAFKLIDQYY
ncbi:hypothetical protein BLX87_23245 [Bacillus sp. VT-16-64]|nr:hypothetical protein BLX87_23245 [Bacillus sp. VT-16-64]